MLVPSPLCIAKIVEDFRFSCEVFASGTCHYKATAGCVLTWLLWRRYSTCLDTEEEHLPFLPVDCKFPSAELPMVCVKTNKMIFR